MICNLSMLMWLKKHYDSFYRWTQPFIAAGVLISSSYLTYDFTKIRHTHPNWERQLDLLQSALPIALLTLAILGLALSVTHLFCRPTIKALLHQLEVTSSKLGIISENVRNLFDGYLYKLSSQKLGFGEAGENNERITIYIHDRTNKFIPFGRYSQNPTYKKAGRAQYPDHEGCIAKGWQNRWHFESSLTDRNYEKSNLEKYNISKPTLDGIKMKSKMYAVMRVDSTAGEQLAVIVVESTDSARFTEDFLKEKLEQECPFIAELITKLGEHIPSLPDAKGKGF